MAPPKLFRVFKIQITNVAKMYRLTFLSTKQNCTFTIIIKTILASQKWSQWQIMSRPKSRHCGRRKGQTPEARVEGMEKEKKMRRKKTNLKKSRPETLLLYPSVFEPTHLYLFYQLHAPLLRFSEVIWTSEQSEMLKIGSADV